MSNSIKERTILVTLGGSRAYGINTEESDVDLKGVFIGSKFSYLSIEPKIETVVDLKNEDKWVGHFLKMIKDQSLHTKEVEGTSYELHKFCRLALQCNPNILDTLFCDESDVVYAHAYGSMIRRAREHFLSKTALNSFYGYAIAQLKLVDNYINGSSESLSRGRGKVTDKKVNKNAAHVVRLLQSFEELVTTGIYNVKRKNKEQLLAIRNGEWTPDWLHNFIDEQKHKFVDLEKKCILPERPNQEVIINLVSNILEDALFGAKKLSP